MTQHPFIYEQLARQHQQDLLADAEHHRRARQLDRSSVRPRATGFAAALRRVVRLNGRRAVRRPATA
jgi:hypothetical protein